MTSKAAPPPQGMAMSIITDRPPDLQGLLSLMSWLSPAFPVGGFSYSHGIEQAVEMGLLGKCADVVDWIGAILEEGSGWIDAVLFLEAHRSVLAGDRPRLDAACDLAAAWRGSGETALEAEAQGKAFLTTLAAAWPGLPLSPWTGGGSTPPGYAIAVAIATAVGGIDEMPALAAYLQGFAGNLISAAVRLVPLGQTDGQRAVAALLPIICRVTGRAAQARLDDLGSGLPMVDLTSMRHETQYTRLFRS